MQTPKETWINTGYGIFALQGENSLKIEAIAKLVGVSKSSFYHFFADLEIFKELLMANHLQQSKIMAEKERNAQSLVPELVNILVEHKIDLLFNRQLRINQQQKLYSKTLAQSNKIVGTEFINIWSRDLGTSLSTQQFMGIYELAVENFYLQINDTNLNYEWLSAYFTNLKKVIKSLEP